MIEQAITFFLMHIPVFCFIGGVIGACVSKGEASPARRWLAWTVLAIGVDGLWAGFFHVFFPGVASAQIGWQPSPFEFEIGVADMAMGAVAVVAFWRSASFQSAIALYVTLFYLGVVIGHFNQAFVHHDFASDNFGVLLAITIIRVFMLSFLIWAVWRAPTNGGRT